MAREVLLIPHNHFDPTWRRCWDVPAVKDGITVRPYAEVEDLVLSAWLAMAPGGHTFTEGQAAVWRKFLERHPEHAETLKQYARDGRLAVTLAGETVQDTNMSAAEGLVRNFLLAMPFYRELCGEDHPALKMAWLEDAFGQSANYPQILRGVGAEVACQTFYRTCPEDVWVGLDGTKILCSDQLPVFGGIGAVEKHPPCPACTGTGGGIGGENGNCPECCGTGMRLVVGWDLDAAREMLEGAMQAEGDVAVVNIGSEEVLPDPRIPALVEELNALHEGKSCIRFATVADVYEAFRPRLEKALAERDDTPTPELNPTMSGCYVTRIAMKQRTRAITYKLTAAEAALANAAWAEGKPAALPEDLNRAWRLIAFNQFHDAITGTHIDAANAELHAMLDEAEAIADRYLAPLPAPAEETFTPAPEGESTVHLGNLDVTFDRTGILNILVGGTDVFGRLPYSRVKRDFRIGELVIDMDYGDAWGQRIPAFLSIENDFTQVQLGDHHDSVEVAENAVRWRGTYKGHDPRVQALAWTVTARASADGTTLEFTTEVDWDTRSHRLRAVFPVASKEDTATWEIPFGYIDRTFEPDKLDYSQWKQNAMEFPALHWVRKSVNEESGVALLNRGLPGYRWMPGRFDIGLLRSPEWEFCAVEAAHYEHWDIDGQRDTGHHVLQYAVRPYTGGISEGDLTRAGYEWNRPHPVEPPFAISGDVVITAWKAAEDGSGYILRLQDAGGRGTEVSLDFGEERTVTVTNLLEQPQSEPVRTTRFTTPLHRFGILTVKIQ